MEIRFDALVEFISQVPIFTTLSLAEVHRLARVFKPFAYEDGDLIFEVDDD